jgi:hypothetical protein
MTLLADKDGSVDGDASAKWGPSVDADAAVQQASHISCSNPGLGRFRNQAVRRTVLVLHERFDLDGAGEVEIPSMQDEMVICRSNLRLADTTVLTKILHSISIGKGSHGDNERERNNSPPPDPLSQCISRCPCR